MSRPRLAPLLGLLALTSAAACSEPPSISGEWYATVALDSATLVSLDIKKSDDMADGTGHYSPLLRTNDLGSDFFVYGEVSGWSVHIPFSLGDERAAPYGEVEFNGTLARTGEDSEEMKGVMTGGRFNRLPVTFSKRRWH